MRIFLAGDMEGKVPKPVSSYKVPYTLQTFYETRNWNKAKIIAGVNQPKEFLLDSGAFTFFHSGKTVDWDKYLESYIRFINEYNIEKFFELDIDAIVGTEVVEKMTEKLENGTGKKAIPVFHQCRGIDWYRNACQKYDYIAISASGLTDETKWTKSENALRYLIKIAHNSGTRVHGLGYTRLSNINNTTVPFDSVDSTSWVSGQKYATVYKFIGGKLVQRKVKGRSLGYKTLNDHNIEEWVKMCNYKAQGDKWQ